MNPMVSPPPTSLSLSLPLLPFETQSPSFQPLNHNSNNNNNNNNNENTFEVVWCKIGDLSFNDCLHLGIKMNEDGEEV